ncbi:MULTISPECIES: transporter substrate-binding domain-containing protein [unclassified Legionella]|uniref:transporter substrate-binding domain-containing protein n=1 Tax=unclassified Legionella TaxID=2622702 RepID=UPI00105472CD|nr:MULTISPECIES: transporter substrate-binding domain-containing protein [unclassified Legionella]MDI9819789.1 transporter substrate-binding domain-containing protein [Legionella sp. PL877]
MKPYRFLFSLLTAFLLYVSTANAEIKIGTVIFDPPFIISLDQGFDIDLIHALCKRCSLDCQLVPMDFNQLFPALESGEIDAAIGGITITPDRRTRYIFSLPYVLSKGAFLVLKNSSINSLADLKGKKIGVLKGEQDSSVFSDYLNQHYPNVFQSTNYNDVEDIIAALSNNTISAAFVHESTAVYWEQNGGGQFRALGNPMLVGDGIGIMSLSKNKGLIQQFNQQIEAMEKDGSYLTLYNTYFGNER